MISQGLIQNWRELANADSIALRLILSQHIKSEDKDIDNTSSTTSRKNDIIPCNQSSLPSIEAIDTWIDAA